MRLSDTIEEFIKSLLTQDEQEIELKRNELAEYFSCAPSQINYVLSTRFTPNHGYLIESRRGGGGCIRIFRMQADTRDSLLELLRQQIGESINFLSSVQILKQLQERNFITAREAVVIKSALSPQALSLPLPSELKDALRAKMLKSMIFEIARNPIENKEEK